MNKFFRNKKICFALFAVYFLGLIYLLYFAFFREGTTTRVNLIPFDSMIPLTVYTFKTGEAWMHWFINVPGNILAFIPMAWPLKQFIKPRVSPIIFWMLILLIPCLAEFLQFVFQTGSCDVDDVILNVVGICLGLLILNRIGKQPRA